MTSDVPAKRADPRPHSAEGVAPVDRRTRMRGALRARRALKAEHTKRRTGMEILADALTGFASETPFLALHIIWFGVWISWNTGLLGLKPFDPFPFGLLTMVVSLEAIFLSIFILMSQSRESQIAELREEVTLQVDLRIEEEVTKTLQLVAGLYQRMGFELSDDTDLQEMLRPLDEKRIEADMKQQIQLARGKDSDGVRLSNAEWKRRSAVDGDDSQSGG